MHQFRLHYAKGSTDRVRMAQAWRQDMSIWGQLLYISAIQSKHLSSKEESTSSASHCRSIQSFTYLCQLCEMDQLLKFLHFAIQSQRTTFNFRHSGTLALSPERQSARMSEIKNGTLGLYGAEHSKCNHMMTSGFKRIIMK